MKNKRLEQDIHLLQLLSQKETMLVANELGISLGALRGQLFRIRRRKLTYQTYINNILALERNSARVRKFATSGSLRLPKEDEEEKY